MSRLRHLSLATVCTAVVFAAALHVTAVVHADMNTDYNAALPDDAWRAPPAAAQRRNTVRADRASIRRGAKLYLLHCVDCHGGKGLGNGPGASALRPKPANLAATLSRYSDGAVAWKIATGRGAMPAWGRQLKDAQIWDTVNYLRHFIAKPSGVEDLPAGAPDMQAH